MNKPLLKLTNINKTFDDGFTAVENFNLEIKKGEFITLLGPSGCGKTTMLKMIGGFELPTHGKILYNGIDIKDMPPFNRPTATVFQDYALFPNMTIYQNIAYGLKLMRTPLDNINNSVYVEAEKVHKQSEKKAKIKIKQVEKHLKSLSKDIAKEKKRYSINSFVSEIYEMRRPQFLATIDQYNHELYKLYGEDFCSKISFFDNVYDWINGALSLLRIPFQLQIAYNDLNEIEKKIVNLKKWYRFKKPIDDKIDNLEWKFNDLDYWISYWQTFPQMRKDNFEKHNITRKLTKIEIQKRISEVLSLVGLKGKEDKFPNQLSGGMQQRVALARAIVIEPEILLLDEPLSALDAKVRKQMQVELKRLHKELGITFILVTHDQEEALTLSDKVVVMCDGEIKDSGTPNQIYDTPSNIWVANFIGKTNIFKGKYLANKKVAALDITFKTRETHDISDNVNVLIRPEDFDVVAISKGFIKATVKEVLYKGLMWEIICSYKDIIINIESVNQVKVGDVVGLIWDDEDVHIIPDKSIEEEIIDD